MISAMYYITKFLFVRSNQPFQMTSANWQENIRWNVQWNFIGKIYNFCSQPASADGLGFDHGVLGLAVNTARGTGFWRQNTEADRPRCFDVRSQARGLCWQPSPAHHDQNLLYHVRTDPVHKPERRKSPQVVQFRRWLRPPCFPILGCSQSLPPK